jgi:hypothetical protein
MMAWVHASIGAALGSRIANNRGAFSAGVASHMIADLIPHRDYPLKQELPLLFAALGFIGMRYGPTSPAMVGALGGIAPDIENGFASLGVLPKSMTIFPTHTPRPWFIGHGKRIESPLQQVILAGLCIVSIELLRSGNKRP